jgi:hypothetical protein
VVNDEGATTIIAVSIIAGEEDGRKFSWIFKHFKLIFGEPSVIITDSCKKIACGTSQEFTTSEHMLCIWHIHNNLYTHVSSILTKKEWEIVSGKFWRLAMQTDFNLRDSFTTEFNDLYAFIELSATTSGKHALFIKQKVGAWLRAVILNRRERYAYRYTFAIFTAGCHSTQRAESIHAAIKSTINSSRYNLLGMMKILINFHNLKIFESSVKKFKGVKPKTVISSTMLDKVREEAYSHYAYKKFQDQYTQTGYYSATKYEIDNILVGYSVVRDINENLPSAFPATVHIVLLNGDCTCQLRASSDIACRHAIVASFAHRVSGTNTKSNTPTILGGPIGKYWQPRSIEFMNNNNIRERSVAANPDVIPKEDMKLIRGMFNIITDSIEHSDIRRREVKEFLKNYIDKYSDVTEAIGVSAVGVGNPVVNKKGTNTTRFKSSLEKLTGR